MPTNAPPRLSINVGTSEADLSNKDIELGYKEEIVNVGRFNSLSVLRAQVVDNFRVVVGKRAVPTFSRFLLWFGFSLLLSLLAPLPIFVAITLPAKNIQKYETSQCTTLTYYERKFVGQEMDFAVKARYTDKNGISRIGELVHNAVDYDSNINLYMRDFYKDSYTSGQPYECYYHEDSIVATDSIKYIINFATVQGWIFMGCLIGAWIIVNLLFALGFYLKSIPSIRNRREISKQTFEGPAHPQMEILDWGDVPFHFRQSVHALLYNYLVPQDQELVAPDAKKYVKFTRVDFITRSKASIYVTSVCAAMTLGGVFVSGAFAFFQPLVSLSQLLWSLATIFALCPFAFSCIAMEYSSSIPFSATAEITCKSAPTEDVRIASAEYSPLRMNGVLVSASMFRTIV